MGVTYTYVQKYSGQKVKSYSPSPILSALNNAIKLFDSKVISTSANRKMGIVISPGYLSTTQSTSDKLINTLLSNHHVIDRTWILGTMNGISKSKIILNNPNNLHYLKVSLNKKTSQPKLNKITGWKRDHRKMIFIVCWEGRRPLLRRKRNIKKFIKRVDVLLATIGSSNFSAATYFMGNYQNEADIIWVDENKLSQIITSNINSLNNSNISFKSEILGNLTDPDSITGLPAAVSGTIESLKRGQRDKFLNNLLKHTLEETII